VATTSPDEQFLPLRRGSLVRDWARPGSRVRPQRPGIRAGETTKALGTGLRGPAEAGPCSACAGPRGVRRGAGGSNPRPCPRKMSPNRPPMWFAPPWLPGPGAGTHRAGPH